MTIDEAQNQLSALLQDAGCKKYSAERARADAQECWRCIQADAIAHGESADEPFFNYVATESIAVLILYEPLVKIYVLRGEEWEFQTRFDELAMTDVSQAKRILASDFAKPSADIILETSLGDLWLGKSVEH